MSCGRVKSSFYALRGTQQRFSGGRETAEDVLVEKKDVFRQLAQFATDIMGFPDREHPFYDQFSGRIIKMFK